jgi:transcriptional regulator with XRE-family HTH domain
MSTFSKLVEQRISRKITQRKMAKLLKCTPSTLNRYEKGNRDVSANMQDDYADNLGLELKIMVK